MSKQIPSKVTSERIEKLKEWLGRAGSCDASVSWKVDDSFRADALAILDDYQRLRGSHLMLSMIVDKLKAELAKQAPLIEAVMEPVNLSVSIMELQSRRNIYSDTKWWREHPNELNTRLADLDAGIAVIKAALSTPPAPLPKEVEEATKTLDGHFFGADFDPVIFGTDDGGPIDAGRERLLSAYAVIKAALRPKVVTREWVKKTIREILAFADGYGVLKRRLRELGHEIEGEKEIKNG